MRTAIAGEEIDVVLQVLPDKALKLGIQYGRDLPLVGHILGAIGGLAWDCCDLWSHLGGFVTEGAAGVYRGARAVFE